MCLPGRRKRGGKEREEKSLLDGRKAFVIGSDEKRSLRPPQKTEQQRKGVRVGSRREDSILFDFLLPLSCILV